jgi:predicted metalloendopeptidase
VIDRRSYAVGKHWVTKIKIPAEKGQKQKFRILKRLRSDEVKAAEELKATKAQEQAKKGRGRKARKSLQNAIPLADEGQDEDEDKDPADCFS